ncbi:MAG: adenylosuccinate synthase [Chloroflexi bacterium]|nr:adenylosuccinate synthase [Chloroflexota bacterium]MBM3182807.1 adenylosuccinate synthase [Chloroflexota bacterium]MBM4451227.1 adenylosuccinate synthase [Chloroflexota bacterium]MBM4453603.1 adenylosuccinate synthase [Chloroflexota bacterium]
MSVVAVIGAQWGDEGKGKIVDLLAQRAKAVVRFSGGDNAGHTIVNPQGEFRLHLVPSGIFYPETVCIIGNGVVVNPAVLLAETDDLNKHNVDTNHLFISDRANLIMPYHIVLDGLEEKRRGKGALGTTGKGIGPAFADKTARLGIRACDLLNREQFRSRLSTILELKNAILTKIYDAPPLSEEEIFLQYCAYGEKLAPFITDTSTMLRQMLSRKQPVLLEGAQGALLDPDWGTYPYVTSSSPLAANAALGCGISLKDIDHIVGVFKAYTTRVGGGPMPTELKDKTGDFIRERAHEYGATTGRPRRCGWFDAVAGKFSAQLNGFTDIALTRLDVLDVLDTIKICTAYQLDGQIIKHFPSDVSILEKCQPVYEELTGWKSATNDIRHLKQLPTQARRYISRLEELLSCPISLISVGAERERAIMARQIG